MPIGKVVMHADLAYKMEAQERLGILMDTAAAAGNLKKNVHRAHVRALKRRAAGRRRKQASKVAGTQEDLAASLATVGVGLELVKVNV